MKISYQKLVADDSKEYREIRLESLKTHPESFGSTYEEQSKLPKLMFEEALEQPFDERFVIGAFDQKELIGICGFIPFVPDKDLDLSHAGTIIQMYVRATYSGRKIGLNLVNATVREAFKIPDIEQIVLGVKEGNISAIRVYEQAGFKTYNLETNKYDFRIMIIHR
jgi:RimJ/RimL family protein N-acetyltransferase